MTSNLDRILNELNNHRRSKDHLYQYYIENRLNQSLKSYYEDLGLCVSHICSKYGADKIVKGLIK